VENLRRRTSRFGLDVVMVNVWEHFDAAEEARNFCDIYEVEGTVLLDEQGSLISAAGVRGVPYNLLVDEEGIVQAAGFTDPASLEQTVARWVPEAFAPDAEAV
jgi:hypothetical protein